MEKIDLIDFKDEKNGIIINDSKKSKCLGLDEDDDEKEKRKRKRKRDGDSEDDLLHVLDELPTEKTLQCQVGSFFFLSFSVSVSVSVSLYVYLDKITEFLPGCPCDYLMSVYL